MGTTADAPGARPSPDSQVVHAAPMRRRRLSKLQMDHSTADERIAATGCAKGRLGCNSFRHTRAENDVGIYAVNFRRVLAEIKAFATERRTTAAMIAGVYCDQPVAQKRKAGAATASVQRKRRRSRWDVM